MDEKRLAELEALASAATPGPWAGDIGQHEPRPLVVRSPVPVNATTDVLAVVTRHQADRDFIAAARAVVPELLAEVKRLREECSRLACHVVDSGGVPANAIRRAERERCAKVADALALEVAARRYSGEHATAMCEAATAATEDVAEAIRALPDDP